MRPPLTRSESAREFRQRRRMMLNMSASSSRGGISRIVSSQGAGSALLSLVQSSMRSSCRDTLTVSRHPACQVSAHSCACRCSPHVRLVPSDTTLLSVTGSVCSPLVGDSSRRVPKDATTRSCTTLAALYAGHVKGTQVMTRWQRPNTPNKQSDCIHPRPHANGEPYT